jgi:parallel beta-helix repeat protein
LFGKTVSVIMMFLLFLGTFALAFRIQVVRADSGTIYISALGGVFPPTAPISTLDNVTYTLSGNIIDGSIIVEKDNVVIDGAGYTVRGTNVTFSKAISVNGNNVTIKNTNIQAPGADSYGIYVEYGYSDDTISGNNVTNVSYMGIVLDHSSNDTIVGNNLMNNWDGIDIDEYSSNNTIAGNKIVNSGYIAVMFGFNASDNVMNGNYVVNDSMGVYFECSSNNIVTMNDMMESNDSFYIYSYPTVDEGVSVNNTVYDNNFVNNRQEVTSIDSTPFGIMAQTGTIGVSTMVQTQITME